MQLEIGVNSTPTHKASSYPSLWGFNNQTPLTNMQRSHISMSSSSISFSSAMRNSRRQRDASGELDVFDATLYFSGGADNLQQGPDRRRSLDASLGAMQKLKQCKKPSTPGGRLASFLVSLFHHTTSKRRSKLITRTSSFAQEVDPKEKNGYAARWRRNSVGHYESTNDYMPMVYAKAAPGAGHPCGRTKGNAENNGHELGSDLYKEDPLWAEVFAGKQMWREEEEEEDSESESSSDLFELKNYDLGGGGGSGLLVCGTTELDSVKRGSAIASAAS